MKNTTTSLHNIFKRYQLAIFGLTFLLCSAIFVTVASYTLQTYSTKSISILSKALTERIQPAVVFNDRTVINKMLNEFKKEYPIHSIEVLDINGNTLAKIEQKIPNDEFGLKLLDKIYFNEPVQLPITHDQQNYGQLIVYGSSSTHASFFKNVLIGLVIGFLLVLLILLWSARSSYRYLMKSIHPIVATAKRISEEKNYHLRLEDSEISEFQDRKSVV